MTQLFVPTELDEHLIVDHGVDVGLIAQTHETCSESGYDYDAVSSHSHDVMHVIGDAFCNHVHGEASHETP